MSNKGPFDFSEFWGLTPPPERDNLFEALSRLNIAGQNPIPTPPVEHLPPLRSIFSPPLPSGSAPLSSLRGLFDPLPPPPQKEPPAWGAEHTRNVLKALLRRRPVFAEGRVLPKLEDLAVMEGRQIEAAFVYTDLDSFTKTVATQPTKVSFVLLQAFVELVTRITGHYGGAVVDCAGDRLLSVFHRPAKNYSEQPVHEAITAAFWIQTMLQSSTEVFAEKGIAPPRVGIGIDYGPATVGCVGFRNNKRLIFLGDAAYNAAKLQDVAGPGETVLSYTAFLRKPFYMNDWTVQQEGLQIRVTHYFAKDHTPPKAK